MGDRALDRLDLHQGLGALALPDQPARHGGVDIGGEQMRSDFVVQVARQIGAFLVLQIAQLILQRVSLDLHGAQALDHVVDAPPQPHQFERTGLAHPGAVVARPDAHEGGGKLRQRAQGAADGEPDHDRAEQE